MKSENLKTNISYSFFFQTWWSF